MASLLRKKRVTSQFRVNNSDLPPECKSDISNIQKALVRLSERSERNGPRAPEAKLGKRNSGGETLLARYGIIKLINHRFDLL